MAIARFVPLVLCALLMPLSVGAMVPPIGPPKGAIIDQQQPIADTLVNGTQHWVSAAQTFTAGRTGILTEVDVPAMPYRDYFSPDPVCFGLSIENLKTTFYAVVGAPDNQPIGPVAVQCFPNDHQVRWAAMQVNVPVVAGTQYAIVLSAAASVDFGTTWYGSTADVYPGGSLWEASVGEWFPLPRSAGDAAFITHVIPAGCCAGSVGTLPPMRPVGASVPGTPPPLPPHR